ncbi:MULTISPECIES: hypothetical protein [unclassified Pseudoalteromonas]|uniref:hypothetical protein n=1 Tax=unclassified Pseudoalteromonas TaxID=194690 RepID=UPI001F2DC32C|nr:MULTISPECIES: hypothetical protein [unclassified Pseudoalteromonas]MCF2829781.1 hypothetical protein [Pseudoalteromonas sp. OF5H-5]MCF2834421.1 hypothetical protein [Pseudoalteromonas sp. DL2-H6]MCF2927747.1 hypothetical protein [Pseudoalteromonas sp. DL2-H1]
MHIISPYIAQCYQRQQSRVLLLVQAINHHSALNMRIAAKFNNKLAQFFSARAVHSGTRFIVNTQPFKQVIKLVFNKVGLHGLISRLRDDQILASKILYLEVPKILSFWNGLFTTTSLQNGGCYDY